jgi:hypothetical protein
MADGFAVVLRLETVRARLVAREPGWEYHMPPCEGGMPATSALGLGQPEVGCAGLDEICDPRSTSPCCDPAHRCAGTNGQDYRCYASCEADPCDYGGRVGVCRDSGACLPVALGIEPSDCVPGEACETEYGQREGTTCEEQIGGDGSVTRVCYAACTSRAADECGAPGHECLPLVGEPVGVCSRAPVPE